MHYTMWATISNNNFVMLILVTSDKHESFKCFICKSTSAVFAFPTMLNSRGMDGVATLIFAIILLVLEKVLIKYFENLCLSTSTSTST